MGLLRNKRLINFQRKEIERIKNNLEKVSSGQFDMEWGNFDNEKIFEFDKEQIMKIDRYMMQIKETYLHLAEDTDTLFEGVKEGNLDYRMDTTRHGGIYSRIEKNINASLEVMSEPVREALAILERMALNDFTVKMSIGYKGKFAAMSNAINDVQKRLLAAQNVAVKISLGDISELENFKEIGQRSENDQLVPAFIHMMEAIQSMIDEIMALSKAAENGNLHVRGNEKKHSGEYKNIIKGVNGILDEIVRPMTEISEVMSQIGMGNLNTLVQGVYKGEYASLADSVNDTVEILNHVVEEIGKTLLEISQGNLNLQQVRNYKGDFGVISTSLNKIIESLNDIFRGINAAAEQVASGAEQISISSQELSQGSEEQASSVEEITATITEMASQVKQSAVNATEADTFSLTVKETAGKGQLQMGEMIKAMHDINTASSNISKIIKVIDDIAFQTNILALNAAVEAARAGQYGKGFAVVAEEVKNLAQQSADAAKETTTMIEDTIRKVDAGTKIVNSTGNALNEIVDGITKTAEIVEQIALASNEQATAISQVNQAVEEISQVIQTTTATAEEGAAASEELFSQAELLKQMVNNIRLKKMEHMSFPHKEELSPEIIQMIEELLEDRVHGKIKFDNIKTDESKVARQDNMFQIASDDAEAVQQ